MKQHLLLIDALNLIRRIYAVDEARSRQNSRSAIKNTLSRVQNAAHKLKNILSPTHAIAVFDGERSWRYHFYPEYKANRAPMPEVLKDALPEFWSAFQEAGILAYSPQNDEADDVIASIASRAAGHHIPSTVVSTDKGFLPLLSEGVDIYDYFKKSPVTCNDVQAKYGLMPHQLCDFWALTGDKTNDIPGVKGIGDKTARSLLSEHGCILSALNNEQLDKKWANKLTAELDTCARARQLVTLRRDIHLGFSLKQLRLNAHR